jgi:hypothetical protein
MNKALFVAGFVCHVATERRIVSEQRVRQDRFACSDGLEQITKV